MVNFIIWLYEKKWRTVIIFFVATIIFLLIGFPIASWVSLEHRKNVLLIISSIYLIFIYLIAIGLIISPTYEYSTKYFKGGEDLLINFEILPFSVNKEKNYTRTDTFNKMKSINSNVQSLSTYDKELLLAYLKAKKSVPIPTLIILGITAIFGVITSLLVKYYESEPLVPLSIILMAFYFFAYPIKNFISGYRRRNLTENYLINLLENEIGPRK